MSLIHRHSCPVCGSTDIHTALEARDHTVSGETYSIWECGSCHLRFTQDVPDETSIAPYYQSDAYVSHSDTRRGLVNAVYHQVRRITLQGKRSWVEKETACKNGDLLDIGAGTGAFLQAMREAGWRVTGLEPDAGARETARRNHGLDLLPSHELYSLPENAYDAITLWHVLEHVHDLHGYMDRFHALLRNKGKLFLALPNYLSADAQSYGSAWAAYDVPRHLYHFSPQALSRLLSLHGFRLSGMKPMWFDPFYISMLSETYRKGRANHPGALLKGLQSSWSTLQSVEKASSITYIAEKG